MKTLEAQACADRSIRSYPSDLTPAVQGTDLCFSYLVNRQFLTPSAVVKKIKAFCSEKKKNPPPPF